MRDLLEEPELTEKFADMVLKNLEFRLSCTR